MTQSDDFIIGQCYYKSVSILCVLNNLSKQNDFQELRLDGNRLKRVPTSSLGGPNSLQNLHLQDNIIGECLIR